MVVLENISNPRSGVEFAKHNSSSTSHGGLNSKSASIFILCERCYWCATYLDKRRVPSEGLVDDEDNSNVCPRCNSINFISPLPIASYESFSFGYTVKRGIML